MAKIPKCYMEPRQGVDDARIWSVAEKLRLSVASGCGDEQMVVYKANNKRKP